MHEKAAGNGGGHYRLTSCSVRKLLKAKEKGAGGGRGRAQGIEQAACTGSTSMLAPNSSHQCAARDLQRR